MNPLALKLLSRLPWFKTAQWLVAEADYNQKVAQWLAAEDAWYFKLLASAWGKINPRGKTKEQLRAELMAAWLAGSISLVMP